MTRQGRYPQELRERAVRMVFEHQDEHPSQWSAITSIASKFGVSSEALHKGVRRAEVDGGIRPGLTTGRTPSDLTILSVDPIAHRTLPCRVHVIARPNRPSSSRPGHNRRWSTIGPTTIRGGGEMEQHPGVFTSDIETQEWEPTPGYPGTEFHALVELDDFHAGLWRITGDGSVTLPWTPPSRETMLVLEGEVRIEIADGPTLNLKPGSMASFPPGAEMTLHVTTPFKDMYVIA